MKGAGLDYILKSETKEEQGWNIGMKEIRQSEVKGGAGLDY